MPDNKLPLPVQLTIQELDLVLVLLEKLQEDMYEDNKSDVTFNKDYLVVWTDLKTHAALNTAMLHILDTATPIYHKHQMELNLPCQDNGSAHSDSPDNSST